MTYKLHFGRWFGGPAALCAVAVVLEVVSASAAAKTRVLATFTVDRSGATPVNVYTWTVPKGIKTVTFDAFGAAGAGSFGTPGLGGEGSGTFSVKPGTVFEIVVGGQGEPSSGGLNGGGNPGGSGQGGGGGGTDVRAGSCAASETCGYEDRIVVGGGGGGSGIGFGGAGGGTQGVTGDSGFQGTQTSGGIAPAGFGGPGVDGSFGVGGSAVATGPGEGGGGGGWFGGGAAFVEGGAGGGSGHVDPLALSSSMQTGVQTGDGKVVISG